MASTNVIFLVVVVALATAMPVVRAGDDWEEPLCNGLGERWCETAHRAQPADGCPRPCRLMDCMGREPDWPKRRGAQRPGGPPTWEEVLDTGLYEFVYTNGPYLCVSSCWNEPWKASCKKWDYFQDKRYCQELRCDHDVPKRRYSGCHKTATGDMKLPWHKPTCKECARIFPAACGAQLKAYLDLQDTLEIEKKEVEKARAVEMAARVHCYKQQFSKQLHAMAMAEAKKSISGESSSGRRLFGKDDDDDDDSSEESDDKKDDQEEYDPFEKMDVNEYAREKVREMIAAKQLQCPPPQCLTEDMSMIEEYYAPPTPPWYHEPNAGGYCDWSGSCNGYKKSDTPWCETKVANCINCKGTWCPIGGLPATQQFPPVTPATYKPAPKPNLLFLLNPDGVMELSPPWMDRTQCKDVLTEVDAGMAVDLTWDLDPITAASF